MMRMFNINNKLSRRTLSTLVWVSVACVLSAMTGCEGDTSDNASDILMDQVSLPVLNPLDSYENSGQARSVIAEGDLVYVADGSFGLKVLGVTLDNKFNSLGALSVSADGRVYDVIKNGDYLYMAGRKDGLLVVDVSTPVYPSLVLSIVKPDLTNPGNVIEPSFLSLSNDRLYVSAGKYFLIYDVSDSASPKEIGRYISSTPNQRSVISGNYAYVAGYNKGLRIFDISGSSNPKLISETGVNYNVNAIEKNGDVIYLGGDDSGLLYLNVSNPASPVYLGVLGLPSGVGGESAPYDFFVWKDFLFVADGDAGVHVVGITNPDSPVLGSTIPTMGSSNGLYVDGTKLFIADFDFVQLVEIFETTDIDGDGVVDGDDVFPNDPSETTDNDNDGEGDNADLDDDNDSVLDVNDAFPFDPTETDDTDGDGVGDNSDVFPSDPNESADFDGDGLGDNADLDDDNDGLADGDDEMPNDPFNLIRITNDGRLNRSPKLDGDQIVWRGYTEKFQPTIYFQDINTGKKIDLAKGIDGFHGVPALSNGQVAWRVWDKVDTYKIYFWDGTIDAPAVEITSYTDGGPSGGFADKKFGFPPSFHSIDVQIHNGTLAWAQLDAVDGDYEIMFWDGTFVGDVATNIVQITNNDVHDYEAQLNNGQITWTADEEFDAGEANPPSFDVFFWDGVDSLNPNIVNASDNYGVPDEDAHLMNGRIAWSGGAGKTNRDINIWDSTTGEISIVVLPGYDYEPQIDNVTGAIAWHNNSSGKYLIHIWDGFGVSQIDYPYFTNLLSPFANNGRVAFVGETLDEPDIYIATLRLDKDEDGVFNGADAFPLDPLEQNDFDRDGVGDNADLDDDNDGVADDIDAFPLDASESLDSDLDGVGDNADFFPNDINEWDDSDLDGTGDAADADNVVILTPVSNLDTPGQARGIYKDGKYIYVADGTNGLEVYELLNDGSFSNIGEFKLPVEPGPPKVDVSLRQVVKVDDYLYLAYREKGLYVLDITDPTNPVEVFNYDTPDRASFIEISGNKLYLSDRFGFIIFDISNPSVPVFLGDYSPPGEIERVKVIDNIAYAAAYYNGVLILDVSDAANPVEVSFENSGFAIWTVAKKGNYIFAGGETSGLIVYDVTNPSNLVEVAQLDLPDTLEPLTAKDQPPLKMQVHGNQLFVADGQGGLQVVDISDPLVPVISAAYTTPLLQAGLSSEQKVTWDFYIDDYTIILGDHFNGIHHLNLGADLDYDGDFIPNYLDPYPQN